MGCPCEIQLFAESQVQANNIASAAIADIQRLEMRYSRYRSDSLLSKINRVADKGGTITLDEETSSLLNYAETCYQQSEGLFDITSGILRRVWQFNLNRLPNQAHIDDLLFKIGWNKLRWNNPTLIFPLSGMELDFGGIVKEYAVDRAANLCHRAGCESGVINLGGDIRILGPRSDHRPWLIGLGKPNRENETTTIMMDHGAVASSGDYERGMTIDGVRYSHIINPKTGWPVQHLAAVTVVAELCVVAGSSSTIAMLKESEGPAWLDSMGLPCLWTDIHGHQGGTFRKIQ